MKIFGENFHHHANIKHATKQQKGIAQQHEAHKIRVGSFFSAIKNFNYSPSFFCGATTGALVREKIEIVVEIFLNENSSTNIILLPTQRQKRRNLTSEL